MGASASSTKRVRPLGGDDLAVAENGLSPGVDSGVDDSPSARDMAERIRKVRADIAETINLQRINEQNLDILRKKVAEARAEKDAEEDRLRARLSQLKAELDSVKNKTVPEWVSTVDVATGLVYFMNTKTKHSQWRAPPDFDGTFVLCDDKTGFIASTRLQASVKAQPNDHKSTSSETDPVRTGTPNPVSNADAQRRLSAASASAV